MREIEFRGQRFEGNEKDGEWVYGSLWQTDTDAEILSDIRTHAGCDFIQAWGNSVDPGTVGQYTGLKDKNGVKIYEGDIVRSLHYVTGVNRHKHFLYHIIEWSENYTGWISINISELHKEKRTGSPPLWVYKNNCEFEIIGNIHDNPELLKGK